MRSTAWPRALLWVLTCSVGLASHAFGATQATGSTTQAPPQAPVTPPPPAPSEAQTDTPEAQLTLERVRRSLSRDPTIKLDDFRLRFYVEIVAKWPTFQEYVGKSDLRNGPTPYAGMTHQDFLNHVTPRELYGSGGIKATELLQFSIVNWLGQSLAKKAIESFRNARDESELRSIRQRIEQELAALRGRDK